MRGALRYRTPWASAAACALACTVLLLWESGLANGEQTIPPLYVFVGPPIAFLGVLLLWVRPWLGTVVIAAGSTIIGAPAESASWMTPLFVAFYAMGRRAPAWQGWVLIAATVLTQTALMPLNAEEYIATVAYATALFGSLWALGRAIRHRARKAAEARMTAAALAAEDPDARAAEVVARERERLGAELVVVVRQAVLAMRDDAQRAITELKGADIRRIGERGATAVSDMRRLLGLLRTDTPAPVAKTGAPAPPRRPRWWLDALAALVLSVAALVDWVLTPEFSGFSGDVLTLWPILLLAAGVAVRRRHAIASAVLLAATAACALLPGAVNPIGLAYVIALCLLGWTIGTRGGAARWIAFAAAVTVTALGSYVTEPSNVAIGLAVPIASAVVGRAWSLRETEQEAHERRSNERRVELDAATSNALAEERRSVARELHDVTSHALGVMVLHAGAAEATVSRDPAVARASLAQVIAAADAALAELDRLGEAFGTTPDTTTPRFLATRISELVDRMRGADLRITAHVQVEPSDPEIAHAIYRVVQEGLTNAARHAPGSHVEVRIPEAAGAVTVVVENDAPRGAQSGIGSGFGLTGVAERVRALGGTLAADPTAEGGFVLSARIPHPADRPSRVSTSG